MVRTQRAALAAELKLRLPLALRKLIVAAAKKRGVSMNTEMVERLTQSFAEQPTP